jgi:hypothetical protein
MCPPINNVSGQKITIIKPKLLIPVTFRAKSGPETVIRLATIRRYDFFPRYTHIALANFKYCDESWIEGNI